MGAVMPCRVLVLVVPPVDELDLVGPLQVLATANRRRRRAAVPYAVEIVTAGAGGHG
jgi:hypothetical protein